MSQLGGERAFRIRPRKDRSSAPWPPFHIERKQGDRPEATFNAIRK